MAHIPDRPVRTRFAPSPTGSLHIGGARTALFSWLLAKHYDGKFILRIEDTDRTRYVEGSLEELLDGLRWLGITWDEGPDVGGSYGPYTQSERLEHYHKWAAWLVENDKAYRCYCTAERLAQVNEEKKKRGEQLGYDRHCRYLTPEERAQREAEGLSSVVRLKAPLDGQTTVHDLIHGEITFDNSTIQDAVLLKSDGFPTYHLAVIVDDHLMEISHVTRSSEWLPSLPLHVTLWNAFGWQMPYYAHLPVILNPNGKGKMSKREVFMPDGTQVPTLVRDYKAAGYIPEAVVNFLTNIGWNFGDDREVFTVEESIERFDITKVNPANAAFPFDKLNWLNATYIQNMPTDVLAAHLRQPLEEAGLTVDSDETLRRIAPLVQERLKFYKDIVDWAGFFFREPFVAAPPEDLIQKKMDAESTAQALERAYEVLSQIDDFTHERLLEKMDALATELGLKRGQMFGVLRVAVTGQRVAPPIFETMEIIGKDKCLTRIQQAAESLKQLT
ncbi:MAG: glutamate--tRNA ligase [Chloroflexi bacterium]|nr:MAG: glutamate--tRNA ligase [Chloroflexota bacterium]